MKVFRRCICGPFLRSGTYHWLDRSPQSRQGTSDHVESASHTLQRANWMAVVCKHLLLDTFSNSAVFNDHCIFLMWERWVMILNLYHRKFRKCLFEKWSYFIIYFWKKQYNDTYLIESKNLHQLRLECYLRSNQSVIHYSYCCTLHRHYRAYSTYYVL